MIKTESNLTDLYEADETAWLEAMAELIRSGACSELDYAHLAEYLTDMAGRDRREVKSRLVVLMLHLLKWEHQPQSRTGSWRDTIDEQQTELADLIGQGVLRRHAKTIFADAYEIAARRAAKQTRLPQKTFPAVCPYTLDQILSFETDESNGE